MSTCFKSCIKMEPMKIDQKKILEQAEINKSFDSVHEYDEVLFNQDDKECLKNCTSKLTNLDNYRAEFDAAFEIATYEIKPIKAYTYIEQRIKDITGSTPNISLQDIDPDDLASDIAEKQESQKTMLKSLQENMESRRRVEFNHMVHTISKN